MAGTRFVINYADESLDPLAIPPRPAIPGKAPFQINPGEFDGPEMFPTDPTKCHTSIHLFGQGYMRYGEKANENFLRLLEHFASPIPPIKPTIGQLWFDVGTNTLMVYEKNQSWEAVGGFTPPEEYVIVAATTNTLYIDRNHSVSFPVGSEFRVDGGPNSGNYEVLSSTYNITTQRTEITVTSTTLTPTSGGIIVAHPFPQIEQPGRIWFNVIDNRLYMWDGDNWVVIFTANSDGNLDMEMVRRIINLPNPINNYDAVNKIYVDTLVNSIQIPIATDTILGGIKQGIDVSISPTGVLSVVSNSAVSNSTIVKRDSVGNINSNIMYSTTVFEKQVSMTGNVINLGTGSYFTKTISGPTTFSLNGTPTTGTGCYFILDLTNGGTYSITLWNGVKWSGGHIPALTPGGRDILSFFSYDGGITWVGLMLGKDVKAPTP